MTKKKSHKTKIFVLDNYDSFVYNLVHYLEELNCEVTIRRSNQFFLDEVAAFDKILLSPGPGIPREAGLLKEVIRQYAATKPILGVCLGHQAICEVFGGRLENMDQVYHGVSTKAILLSENEPLFKNLVSPIEIGRYHSWIASKKGFPEELEITSEDENGQIMSIRHRWYDVCGIQFHPESILTPNGKQIIENWINSQSTISANFSQL
ncbi:MAG: aminodeoxychorismate/anthranilate synthase component II [Aequorivita sp.]